jgi:hypothetical protein
MTGTIALDRENALVAAGGILVGVRYRAVARGERRRAHPARTALFHPDERSSGRRDPADTV